MRRFNCAHCHAEIFFDSLICEACQSMLIYDPVSLAFCDVATPSGVGRLPCANRDVISCNWAAAGDEGSLCQSCVLTTQVPNLQDPSHILPWARLETAKRLVVTALDQLRLDHPPKSESAETGLAFQFLADDPNGVGPASHVLTGHDEGNIVVNIAEGVDAVREQRRTAMKEPYRTLVGHIRHELGHYYWDRLVRDEGALSSFRSLFGDEREDYAEALKRHYDQGARANWREHFISAYASSHPWEDFAETWAHYMHTVEGLQTAVAFGLTTPPADAHQEVVAEFPYLTTLPFKRIASIWAELSIAVNALNKSMGQPDLYPFVLSSEVIEKLGFVHELIVSHARRG